MKDQIFFKDSGRGIPVVFIHGLALDHSIWDPLIPLLEKKFRNIRVDLRGHGHSFIPLKEFSLKDMGDDVIRMMDLLKIDKAFVFGHSLGGYISLSILANHSERVTGIALIASHIFSDSTIKREQRFQLAKSLEKSNTTEVFKNMPSELSKKESISSYCEELIAKTQPNGLALVLKAMALRPSYEDLWKTSNIPSLIIAGTDDNYIPLETSRKMQKIAPNTRLVEIEHAGHMPTMEYPALTCEALSSFIGQL